MFIALVSKQLPYMYLVDGHQTPQLYMLMLRMTTRYLTFLSYQTETMAKSLGQRFCLGCEAQILFLPWFGKF